jgi:predicted Zn-dependent protease
MVRGAEFIHPVMRFSLRFPDNWDVTNGADQVSAVESERGNVAMILQLSKSNASSPETAARADMAEAGLRQISGRSMRINGLDAFAGTYEGTTNNVTFGMRAAHIRSGERTFIFGGMATTAEFARAEGIFNTAIQTFRQLSQQEADRIQPNRLDFYTVRSGDTWESIAKQGGAQSPLRASSVAIMNGSDPATPPKPGTRVRIVVGG